MAEYDVAVVGAGYVGVPLAATFAEADCRVLLVDVLDDVVAALNRGESHIVDVPSERLAPLVERGLIHATTEYVEVGDADAIVIALPTPLSRQREPDLSIVESAAGRLGEVLREGQVVVLESTTWPGTTREVLQPILEAGSGLRAGEGFFLAMSPERVDPGREDWTTKTTPKVLGGITPECSRRAAEVYRKAIDTVHELSSPEAAELTKLLENAGSNVSYHDPHVPRIHEEGVELSSVAYEPQGYDCVVVVTDHSALDYDQLVDEASLVVDLRNATGVKGSAAEHVFKL